MSLAAPIQNQKQKGQPAARRYQRFKDQHGRKWGANIELVTGDPTGGIDPIGWVAPWMPDMKYLKVRKDEEGLVEVGQLEVDYELALRDAQKEQEDYKERLGFFANAIYSERAGQMLEEVAKGKPPAELMRYFRGAKVKAVEPIFAAMSGDTWILGFVKGEAPEYLRPWFNSRNVRVQAGTGELELDLDPAFLAAMDKAFSAQQTAKQRARDAMTPRQREIAERARAEAELEAKAAAERAKVAA